MITNIFRSGVIAICAIYCATSVATGYFQQPVSNLSESRVFDFIAGKALFERQWIAAPASTIASDGLGPLYNARSCDSCHPANQRGSMPRAGKAPLSLAFKIDIPGGVGTRRALTNSPEPVYGSQLQTVAIPGHRAEATVAIRYADHSVDLLDGEVVVLRKPEYEVQDLGYGEIDENLRVSPRSAPPLVGLGFLEAISSADVLANADEHDDDGDGISGRVNYAYSVQSNRKSLGRFGHKAGTSSVNEQTQMAFSLDLGMSSTLFREPWGDCTTRQTRCRKAIHGANIEAGSVEISKTVSAAVVFYLRNLDVPAARDQDHRDIVAGKQLFYKAGCNACHVERYRIEHNGDVRDIFPYTDLLLHDMGGELADNRPEGIASGKEWRTAPLWAIGLSEANNAKPHFLHDGRARTLLEAILWHDGEARKSRQAVIAMSKHQRRQLLAFLTSI